MPRPRSFDEAVALGAVEDLFWQQGYEATSYADLMRVTGLGKGSLYAAFGDKQTLYLRVLKRYIDREVDLAGKVLLNDAMSGEERLGIFLQMPIDAVADRADRRGCFMCNAAVDMAPFDPETEKMVTAALDVIVKGVAVPLAACSGSEATPEGIFASYIGMRVMAKAGVPVDMLISARKTALLAIRS